jgi:1-deoxy-D-xylulose-5-phosphate reductoisomerase
MKRLSILGATGSIGIQTLDVLRKSPGEFELVGVTANSSVEKMKDIIKNLNLNILQ